MYLVKSDSLLFIKFEKYDDKKLIQVVYKYIDKGNIIGWFQGKMEWGPRALGNRSILGDPRRSDMKDILNQKLLFGELIVHCH